jgi:hypothetical protein
METSTFYMNTILLMLKVYTKLWVYILISRETAKNFKT